MTVVSLSNQSLQDLYQAADSIAADFDNKEDLLIHLLDKAQIAPKIQNVLDKVEKILLERGLFSEEFNANLCLYKNYVKRLESIGLVQMVSPLYSFYSPHAPRFKSEGRLFAPIILNAYGYKHMNQLSPEDIEVVGEISGIKIRPQLLQQSTLVVDIFNRILGVALNRDESSLNSLLPCFAKSYEEALVPWLSYMELSVQQCEKLEKNMTIAAERFDVSPIYEAFEEFENKVGTNVLENLIDEDGQIISPADRSLQKLLNEVSKLVEQEDLFSAGFRFTQNHLQKLAVSLEPFPGDLDQKESILTHMFPSFLIIDDLKSAWVDEPSFQRTHDQVAQAFYSILDSSKNKNSVQLIASIVKFTQAYHASMASVLFLFKDLYKRQQV